MNLEKKINHKYNPEIIIPFSAIDNNIDFVLSKTGEYITSDKINVNAVLIKAVHGLSKESLELISSLYAMSIINFLNEWYNRLGNNFQTLELLHIKLIKND